ncbi:MAG: hypothetical protein HC896_03985 [Bacteroidales bacterium]|nr:hypothetical protein [Bacteroidales bacterium]
MHKLVFAVLLILPQFLEGQDYNTENKKAIAFYEKALGYMYDREFVKVIENGDKALSYDSTFTEAWLLKGEAHFELGEKNATIYCYQKGVAVNPARYHVYYLFLGDLQYGAGRYQEAYQSYLVFLEHAPASSKYLPSAKRMVKRYAKAAELAANPVDFKPASVGDGINSSFSEYWPSLSADGTQMIFTRLIAVDNNKPHSLNNLQEDFFMSILTDTGWCTAVNIGHPVNSVNSNEGAQTLSVDGSYMYFTACMREDGKGLCDIYYAQRIGQTWSYPKTLATL